MVIKKIGIGIGSGITAGALWGLIFLAPEIATNFTPLELSLGRYVAYGVVSALLIASSWRRLWQQLSWKEWRGLIFLSLTGNIFYYLFLATAVQTGGVAMTSLVIGFLPVVITLAGRLDNNSLRLRKLIPSLLLSIAGLICISWQALTAQEHHGLSGMLYALAALFSWSMYAVCNSRWLGRLRSISAHQWNLLTGVVTGALALILAIPSVLLTPTTHSQSDLFLFTLVVSGVAIFCSVMGNGLWNYASKVLPLTLTGQLIVSESIFGLAYGFLWEQRWPSALELAAIGLMITGVVHSTSAHHSVLTKNANTTDTMTSH
ncbi:drug/metabolite transporter (DMT)-like permease [Herbaspirillum sp. Sphag1AN]|uniref:DMT family transporter n=1 Tax=unclassified Herbaspirillum TaxID=2624150 RepID=UPI001614F2F5|nr:MULTISPECIES: DMT family transporter [unclassified Herbaspirillum]MBB3211354.1 drug/metabolite transporter (DMT)-like permease [Herbaspirillum sp. Sphag1AN]MBB3245379.1 drug/metabolite transporter (DMT)-like permease [Herbaspirillum sp. Sphag64]